MSPLRWLAAPLLALPLFAQEPPRHVESVEVNVINVDVVVTDRDGKRVSGLSASDFTLREDGRPRAITNFSEYRASVNESATDELRRPRRIILFIDSLYLTPPRRERLLNSLLLLVNRSVGERDSVTVLTWRGRLETALPFTSDVNAAYSAIDRLVMQPAIDPHGGERRGVELEQEWFAMSKAAYEANQQMAAAGIEFDAEAHLQLNLDTRARREYADVAGRVGALNQVMETMGGVDARTILVIASTRFTSSASGRFETATGRSAARDARWSTLPLMQSLAGNANANQIAIYAIQPEGQPSSGPSAEIGGTPTPGERAIHDKGTEIVLADERESLALLAESTGGLVAFGPVATERLISDLADDLGSYYSLGYRSMRAAEGSRSIEIAATGGLRVRARRTVVEKSAMARARDRVLANLFHPIDDSKIPIRATAKAPSNPRREIVVPIEVQIPIGALTLIEREGSLRGAFSVMVASSQHNNASEVVVKRQPLDIPPQDAARARQSFVTYRLEAKMRAGACCISVGVLDETSQEIGLSFIDLRAPAPVAALPMASKVEPQPLVTTAKDDHSTVALFIEKPPNISDRLIDPLVSKHLPRARRVDARDKADFILAIVPLNPTGRSLQLELRLSRRISGDGEEHSLTIRSSLQTDVSTALRQAMLYLVQATGGALETPARTETADETFDAEFTRAAALSQGGDFDEAIVAWRSYLARNPGDAYAHYNLGTVYLAVDDFPSAAGHLQQSVRLNPQNDVALYNLAFAYFKLQQTDEARRLAQRALELNPGYARAARLLGELEQR